MTLVFCRRTLLAVTLILESVSLPHTRWGSGVAPMIPNGPYKGFTMPLPIAFLRCQRLQDGV